MTRETAKRMLKGHPLSRRQKAVRDIDERAYIETELVPVFELDGGNYRFDALYKLRADDGEYIYGRAMSLDELCKMQAAAARGEFFHIMYLEQSRIIVEIEDRDD